MDESKRHVILFQDRFWDKVRDDEKLQTIRKPRKREIHAGDVLDLRGWSGTPRRSKQVRLCERVCSGVISIELKKDGVEFWDGDGYRGWPLDPISDLDFFARGDGFRDFIEMREWFLASYGEEVFPFQGVLIQWEKGGVS